MELVVFGRRQADATREMARVVDEQHKGKLECQNLRDTGATREALDTQERTRREDDGQMARLNADCAMQC